MKNEKRNHNQLQAIKYYMNPLEKSRIEFQFQFVVYHVLNDSN